MATVTLRDFSWERMIAAVKDVRQRACRATAALGKAGIAHVVIGGNAVAAWVARVAKEAVRNTKDVDLLIFAARISPTRSSPCNQSASSIKK